MCLLNRGLGTYGTEMGDSLGDSHILLLNSVLCSVVIIINNVVLHS